MPQNPMMLDEYSAEQQDIQRQRRLADALRQQGLAPMETNRMAGNMVIRNSPLEVLAKALQGYTAGHIEKKAGERERGLVDRRSQALAQTLSGMPQARQETTQTPFDMASVGQDMPGEAPIPGLANQQTRTVQPGPQDYATWMGQLAQLGPQATQIGSTMVGLQEKQRERGEDRQLKREEGAENRAARLQEKLLTIEALQADKSAGREMQLRLAQMADETRKQIAADSVAARREIAGQTNELRRDLLAQGGKPPAGYRRTADGNLEAIPGGPGDKSNKPMNEFQGKSTLYGTRAAQSHKILNEIEEKISTAGLSTKQSVAKVPVVGGLLGSVGNVMLSKNQQKVEQAQRDFVNAVLRQESGAVISDQEFANAQKQYFVAPGDSPEVIQQKKANRELAIQGFSRMAGPGSEDIDAIRNQPLMPGDKTTPERRSGDRRTPPGVDPQVWAVMTPEERALWKR